MPTTSKNKPARPHVSVNMAVSLDGRITTRGREQITLGSRHDRHLMDVLRAESDAVIVGAGTVRHDGFPVLVRDAKVRRARMAKGIPAHPVNVVMSRSLDMPAGRSIFKRTDTEKVIFTTPLAPETRVRRFGRFAEVVVLSGRSLSPAAVLRELGKRGLRKVLMEGGGELHFAFAQAHLVDDIYVTLTPRLIGGDAPSLLDGRGFLKHNHLELKLVSHRRIGDELFLHYRVVY